MPSGLSPIAALVRRNDPDRFFTGLFAPPEKRETLFVLYAFNHEIARAREVVSQPLLALMRLQWWREVVEGAPRRHEVAAPLSRAVARGELDRAALLALIEAREVEAEPAIETLAEWHSYLMRSAGGLAVAAAQWLGAPEPEAVRPLGAAYGVAGVLRSVPNLARQSRCLLPVETLTARGTSIEVAIAAPNAAPVLACIHDLADEGRAFLAAGAGVRLPRRARAAALTAAIARRDLTRAPAYARQRGLGDRLAVLRAAVTGSF